jgi:hypothetical protein
MVVASKKPLDASHGQVERGSTPWPVFRKVRSATPASALWIRIGRFSQHRDAGCDSKTAICDSKAHPGDYLATSPQLRANFSFTNQRADSFSLSGVNLEAKV